MAGKKQLEFETSLVTQYFGFKLAEQVNGVDRTMTSVVNELCELTGKSLGLSRAYDWMSGKYSPPVIVQRVMIEYTLKWTLLELNLMKSNGELDLSNYKMRRLALMLLPPPLNLARKIRKNPKSPAAKEFQKGLLRRVAEQKMREKKIR